MLSSVVALAVVGVLGVSGADYYLDRTDVSGGRAGWSVSCAASTVGCAHGDPSSFPSSLPLVLSELPPLAHPRFLESRLGVSARAAGLSDAEAERLHRALALGPRVVAPASSPFSPEIEARLLEIVAANGRPV